MAEFGQRFRITRRYESARALLKDGGVDALVGSNYLHAPHYDDNDIL